MSEPSLEQASSLEWILEAFNTAIKEEHAWAICYQCCKCLLSLQAAPEQLFVVSEASQLLLQPDGDVHPATFRGDGRGGGEARRRLVAEREFVRYLGKVIFAALDYGFTDTEERIICQELELLIVDMLASEASQQQETDDEGIENDSEEGKLCDRNKESYVNNGDGTEVLQGNVFVPGKTYVPFYLTLCY